LSESSRENVEAAKSKIAAHYEDKFSQTLPVAVQHTDNASMGGSAEIWAEARAAATTCLAVAKWGKEKGIFDADAIGDQARCSKLAKAFLQASEAYIKEAKSQAKGRGNTGAAMRQAVQQTHQALIEGVGQSLWKDEK